MCTSVNYKAALKASILVYQVILVKQDRLEVNQGKASLCSHTNSVKITVYIKTLSLMKAQEEVNKYKHYFQGLCKNLVISHSKIIKVTIIERSQVLFLACFIFHHSQLHSTVRAEIPKYYFLRLLCFSRCSYFRGNL